MDQPSIEDFSALIRPQKRTDRVVENTAYLRMMWRMVRALEARSIDDPEMLPQVIALTQRLSEVVNVTIASSAARYSIDPRRGASMAECGRVLGITKQSASERKQRGELVIAERIKAAGAVQFAEAQREKAAIKAAEDHAVVHLSDYIERRTRRAS